MDPRSITGLAPAYFDSGTSSFIDFLSTVRPDLLPTARGVTPEVAGGVPHGTTIVAAAYDGGVVIAGDRRATMGNLISQRDMQKVYITDDYSAAGIAGTAGLAVEAIRLFAVDLEHYEKLEGVGLTFDGKSNRLASMIRGNLGAAMQGLSYVPLFAGYDLDAVDPARAGRIVSYDVVGGRYEEHGGYAAVGSGSLFARSSLKKLHDVTADRATTVRNTVEALYDAADDDSATGGPDTVRHIFPIVVAIDAQGAVQLPADEVQTVAEAVIAGRRERATS
ncbi:proteasome subunit beta [Actinomycetospora sp. NBRC 106378]|jgi:proteasome beta subunit|uniref:proteasome subunit beta n=1 Tax=Actinomycetospora sp. NBRC 106378 TaxID=3032208 RepID=UPI0024A1F737|nr:proteasome subunit beta [Actinomycetospora sp. NBRC 106378]GLZ52451.1 proteasome subunit beta [Actinomycetospora sp. NBRC 106378]